MCWILLLPWSSDAVIWIQSLPLWAFCHLRHRQLGPCWVNRLIIPTCLRSGVVPGTGAVTFCRQFHWVCSEPPVSRGKLGTCCDCFWAGFLCLLILNSRELWEMKWQKYTWSTQWRKMSDFLLSTGRSSSCSLNCGRNRGELLQFLRPYFIDRLLINSFI